MDEKTLNQLISIHDEWKMLNWWEDEKRFQIIVETIATQQCKLIDGSTWTYELKLLADECTKGNMINEVEVELEEWLKENGTTWKMEADTARKLSSDWSQNRIRYIGDNSNRKASIATRSLWAWYGRNFPKRVSPKFITTKEWSNQHKEWLLNTDIDDIINKMTFKIIAKGRKLQGIREFIRKEKDGEFRDLTIGNAIQKLKSIASVGDETARKIALFYFDIPILIFDVYLLRISMHHQWISPQFEKWNAKNVGDIDRSIRFWLRDCDPITQSKKIKKIHALIDDCGNLYCKKEARNCNECPLSKLVPSKIS